MDYPERPTLWMELVGSREAAVEEEMEIAERLCREADAEDITAAHHNYKREGDEGCVDSRAAGIDSGGSSTDTVRS
jgi:hypothetical protein